MAIHAACCRCAKWFEKEKQGAGFDHTFVGLCPQCSGEVGDLAAAIERLTRRISSLGEDAREYRRQLSQITQRREDFWNALWGITGSAARFFAALGAVALAARPFATRARPPGPPPPPSPQNQMAHDVFADMTDLILGLDPETFAPSRRTEIPPDNLAALARADERPANVVARAFPGPNTNRETSLDTAIRASSAEFDTFIDRIHAGESALAWPGAVNTGGPDHLQFEYLDDGRVQVWVTDATKNIRRPVQMTQQRWDRWLREDVRPAIDALQESQPDLYRALDEAYEQNRVYFRQAKVDYSPTPGGQGRISWEFPEAGRPWSHPNPILRQPRVSAGAALGRAAGNVLGVAALVGAFVAFAAATDAFSTNIGEYFLAAREAEDLEKLVTSIEQKIDEATKEKQCLLAEQKNREGGPQ